MFETETVGPIFVRKLKWVGRHGLPGPLSGYAPVLCLKKRFLVTETYKYWG